MGISISKVRIKNFRSIENLELSLSTTNVLIGANNCGKSNFLRAINIALGQNKIVSSEDIYIGKDEVLDNTKCATITKASGNSCFLSPVEEKGAFPLKYWKKTVAGSPYSS